MVHCTVVYCTAVHCTVQRYIVQWYNYVVFSVLDSKKYVSNFGVEKLITSEVGLYQNQVENFLKKMVESELSENVQGISKTSAQIS